MSDDSPESYGEDPTIVGRAKKRETQSQGDEATNVGIGSGSDDGLYDDDMEVVDLESRYTTEGTLGKGGMGEVLLAKDTRLNRKVAIKRILGSAARRKTAVNRFLTEAQSIAALNHPNIVQIYDYGRAKDGPFLIMEYVEGSSLLDKCREGAIPVEEAIELACQLCDGLEKAHAANIVHRDIKPANVLLTPDGVPKLTDFGLAKAKTANTGMTMAGAVLGTLDFMPPEQRRDASLVDERSDIWSLAATLYQMLTGKSPKIIKFNDVPKSFHDVLGKALEDKKEDRYQTTADFKGALQESLAGKAKAGVELEDGDCPSCGKKNPPSRKFCGNEDCGISLEVPCVSCSKQMPMWDKVCDSCGTGQTKLLESRKSSMDSEKVKAEGYLGTCEYDEAIKIANVLRDEQDLRLRHLTEWATSFLEEIETNREKEFKRISGFIDEATTHQKAHDYKAALVALEQTPIALENLRLDNQNQTVLELRGELECTLDEIKGLSKHIKEHVANGKLDDGLLGKVKELLDLQPSRSDMKQLRDQLIEREAEQKAIRDEAYVKAVSHYANQDYEKCLHEISRIPPPLVIGGIPDLQVRAKRDESNLKKLRSQINQKVQSEDFEGLISIVKSALELAKTDKGLKTLQDQLIKREAEQKAVRDEAYAQAKSHYTNQAYEKCLYEISRISPTLVIGDIRDLRVRAERDKGNLKKLMDQIQKKVNSEGFEGLIGLVKSALELAKADIGLKTLQNQLIKREAELNAFRDEAYAQARIHYANQNYEKCLHEISRISPTLVVGSILGLKLNAEKDQRKLKELRERIQADVRTKQLSGLLPLVVEAITLDKNTDDLIKLRGQLEKRKERYLADKKILVANATLLRKQCKFGAAIKELRKIESEFSLGDSAILFEDCRKLQKQQASAMNALRIPWKQTEDYERGLNLASAYHATLAGEGLTDGSFNQAYAACRSALKVKQEAAAAAERKKKLVFWGRVSTVALVIIAVVVYFYVQNQASLKAASLKRLLASGDYYRALKLDPTNVNALSMKKAADDAERLYKALVDGDYQTALQLDPTNFKALSMRKNAADDAERLYKALVDGDYQTALQLDPANVEALSMKKAANVKKVKKALESGDYQTALQLDPENTQALSMKKAADAAERLNKALDDGDYQTALQLDPANVEALIMRKNAANIEKALDNGDYQTALQLDPANVEALVMRKKAADIKERIEKTVLTLKGHLSDVFSVAYSPDGNSIVSGSSDNTIKIWDAKTGTEKLTLTEHAGGVHSVAYSPDGNSIVSGSWDDTLKIWDAKTGEKKLTLKGHRAAVYSVAFSPDGNSIVSGSDDETIKIWDAKTGKVKLTLTGHTGSVWSVAYSPNGNSIVSGSDDTLKISDAKTGKVKLTLMGHTGASANVAFSPDGNSIVSGSSDDTLKIWDAKTGEKKLTLKGHRAAVYSVAFSPDGNSIVSGSDNETIKIWDAKTGKVKLTLTGHTGSVWSVAYSPNGNSIVSGSHGGVGGMAGRLKIWDVSAFSSE